MAMTFEVKATSDGNPIDISGNLDITLDDGENEDGGNEADTCEHAPDGDEVEVGTPHETRHHYKLVADSRGTKPKTHHQTCILGRSHLRHEGDADG